MFASIKSLDWNQCREQTRYITSFTTDNDIVTYYNYSSLPAETVKCSKSSSVLTITWATTPKDREGRQLRPCLLLELWASFPVIMSLRFEVVISPTSCQLDYRNVTQILWKNGETEVVWLFARSNAILPSRLREARRENLELIFAVWKNRIWPSHEDFQQPGAAWHVRQ